MPGDDEHDDHGHHAHEPHESPPVHDLPVDGPGHSLGADWSEWVPPFANYFEAFIHPPGELVEVVEAGEAFDWTEFLIMGGSSVGIALIGNPPWR